MYRTFTRPPQGSGNWKKGPGWNQGRKGSVQHPLGGGQLRSKGGAVRGILGSWSVLLFRLGCG